MLWNKELQPEVNALNALKAVFEKHVPGIFKPESLEEQIAILKQIGAIVTESNLFEEPLFGWTQTEVVYSSRKYVELLSSYSPYIQLDRSTRDRLFNDIRSCIRSSFSDRIPLNYVTGYHLAEKAR